MFRLFYLIPSVLVWLAHDLVTTAILDLHGVPGSENGFDNSGHRGAINWNTAQSNIDRSSAIIKTLAAEFSQAKYNNVVSAIGGCFSISIIIITHVLIYLYLAPMNEPAGYSSSGLLSATRQYWYDSYGNIRENGNLVEVIHDAFQALTYWNGVMPSSGFSNVMMDTHHYEIFSDAEEALSYPQHISVRRARPR